MIAALAAAPPTSDSVLHAILTAGGLLETYAEFWLWLTLVVMLAEIFTTGFFLGALAVSSLVTALAAWLGLTAEWQVGLFAVSSIGSLLWVRPVAVRLLTREHVATNTDALVGARGQVVSQVPAGGVGRVRLANEEWRATSEQQLDVGAPVKVLAVQGNTLSVGPV